MLSLLGKTLLTGILFISTGAVLAEEVIMPFVLASKSGGDVASVSADVRNKLTGAGFEVVGEYSPYDGANVIVVTNESMKAFAAKSDFGAYGAVEKN